ncbi:ammonium transporter [Acidocella sp.]|uniref:ammonium transporter n=1 Tax=Acidocella sp. TaxID=50710 RepID=UPI003CFFBE8E
MASEAKIFMDQVALSGYLEAVFYILATLGVMIAIAGIILIDVSLVKKENIVDTAVQKILCVFIGGASFMVVGYAIWNWQYDQAFAVPNSLGQAISDWSIFGTALTHFSQNLDPAAYPTADTFQIFSIFFFCFAGLAAVLLHGAGLERIKPRAAYATVIIMAGIVLPVAEYLTYGSASFLTNMGLHDYVGAYCVYMVVGVWAVVLAWRLGPRLVIPSGPNDFTMLSVGVLLLLIGIPLFVVGCGFLVPGQGFFGPSMSTSGLGIVFTNVFLAFSGGAVAGGLISYRTRKPAYILLGPVAGYVACTALFDIALPWQAFIIALFGPVILYAGEAVLRRFKIDDAKVAPLALGPSVFSAIVAGIIGRGIPQGGYFGLKDGSFAFQHAHISLEMQLLGIAVIVGGTAIIAFIVTVLIEKTIGLRLAEGEEKLGLDASFWTKPAMPQMTDMPFVPEPVSDN